MGSVKVGARIALKLKGSDIRVNNSYVRVIHQSFLPPPSRLQRRILAMIWSAVSFFGHQSAANSSTGSVRGVMPCSAIILARMIAEQGITPLTDPVEELAADWWPKNETADQIIASIRRWRREGGGRKD